MDSVDYVNQPYWSGSPLGKLTKLLKQQVASYAPNLQQPNHQTFTAIGFGLFKFMFHVYFMYYFFFLFRPSSTTSDRTFLATVIRFSPRTCLYKPPQITENFLRSLLFIQHHYHHCCVNTIAISQFWRHYHNRHAITLTYPVVLDMVLTPSPWLDG